MKKTQKVSIAGISFILDDDAYVSLKSYLDSLHRYYADDPDGGEIISDLEGRIAELILDEQVYTKIVPLPLIDTIVAQLGTPEQIDDDTSVEGAPVWSLGSSSGETASIPRRLYRAREGRVLGGVCIGIANYFEISVAWIRLLFLFPLILCVAVLPFQWGFMEELTQGWWGAFLMTYIVLWIALPSAKTPRQRLEARGEKITPESIRQNLVSAAKTPSAKKAASIAAEISTVIGRIVLFFIKFVLAIIGFSLLFAALGIFIAMIIVVSNPAGAIGDLANVLLSISHMTILSPLWLIELILFCVMVPLGVIGMAFLAFAFAWKIGRSFFGSWLILWALGVAFLSVVLISNAGYLRDNLNLDVNHNYYWRGGGNQDYHNNSNRVEIKRIPSVDQISPADTLSWDSVAPADSLVHTNEAPE